MDSLNFAASLEDNGQRRGATRQRRADRVQGELDIVG